MPNGPVGYEIKCHKCLTSSFGSMKLQHNKGPAETYWILYDDDLTFTCKGVQCCWSASHPSALPLTDRFPHGRAPHPSSNPPVLSLHITSWLQVCAAAMQLKPSGKCVLSITTLIAGGVGGKHVWPLAGKQMMDYEDKGGGGGGGWGGGVSDCSSRKQTAEPVASN